MSRRIDKMLPNSLIHNSGRPFMLKGRALVSTYAGNINTANVEMDSTFELSTLTYAIRKENEALLWYLSQNQSNPIQPNSLADFYKATVDDNESKLNLFYRKCHTQMKYDNAKLPISNICGFVYVGFKKEALTLEFFDQYLRDSVAAKLAFACEQDLIDLVTALTGLGASQEDPLVSQSIDLLVDKMSVTYEGVTNVDGQNDTYQWSSNTKDDLTLARYGQYWEAYQKDVGGFSHTGRWKFMLRAQYNPLNFLLAGRVFRRSWKHHHVYDKPSQKVERDNFKEVLKELKSEERRVKLLIERTY